MKIAFFSWESLYSVSVGGVANHVTEIAAALQRRGHEVHVFVRKKEGQEDFAVHDGVVYHKVPIDINPDFVSEMYNMGRSLVWHMAKWQNDHGMRFDIIHSHDWMCTPAMVSAKNDHDQVVVMTVHSTEYGRSGNSHHGGSASHRIRRLEDEGLYVADRVISVSGPLCTEVRQIYNVPEWKLRTIPNGIRCNKFDLPVNVEEIRHRYRIGPMDPTLLFVGRLSWQKGPDLLLESIPFVLRHRSDVKFVFVGDGHMRWDLDRRMHQLGVSHAVRFLGGVTGDELHRIFRSSDAVCVPSRNEPFGIVILEAWAARKPVIVTPNGGPRDIVTHGQNGFHVFDNPGSIAWGVCEMFNNFERAHGMGNAGRHLAESVYNWDTLAEHTESVYHEALEARQRPIPKTPVKVEETRIEAKVGPVRNPSRRRAPKGHLPNQEIPQTL
jgi:glycosyltransferase involved in cell wall biosynthesis